MGGGIKTNIEMIERIKDDNIMPRGLDVLWVVTQDVVAKTSDVCLHVSNKRSALAD